VLKGLPLPTDPNLLVGHSLADDAGVYRLGADTALVLTVDFFQPVVDDAFDFGRVAAANSVSDVYAMGGRPIAALNIVCFPEGDFPLEILETILRGGADVVAQAGAVIAGGHTVKDKELKYGLAVVGLVHPDRVITNGGAQPGDKLILTKPLGTGILATALRAEKLDPAGTQLLVDTMVQLNKEASRLMIEHGAHACTDITGYGLLGHAYEMASASQLSCAIQVSEIPVLEGALEFAAQGMNPGGSRNNRKFVAGQVSASNPVDTTREHLLYDPQTSGGLLIAVPQSGAENLLEGLKQVCPASRIIGEVIPRDQTALKLV
jgi:selenide,water dikinase